MRFVPKHVRQMIFCLNGLYSARTDILGRYSKFVKSLKSSPSDEIRILVNIVGRDVQSNTGRNLKFLEHACGVDPWSESTGAVKRAINDRELVEVPTEDAWR